MTVEELCIFEAGVGARRLSYRRLGAVGSLSPDSFRPSRMPVAAALGQVQTILRFEFGLVEHYNATILPVALIGHRSRVGDGGHFGDQPSAPTCGLLGLIARACRCLTALRARAERTVMGGLSQGAGSRLPPGG